MHNNYYFLRQLTRQLKEELAGFAIAGIFSQAKDELVVALLRGKDEKYIKAQLTPPFCCLTFPAQFNRAGKNSVDLFRQIVGQKVVDIVQVQQDRSFYLQTSAGYVLLFKMHGNRSNVVLIKKDEVVQVFRNKLTQDAELRLDALHRDVDLSFEAFNRVEGDYKKLIPTFGNTFDDYFQAKEYALMSPGRQYDMLMKLLEYLKKPEFFIHQPAASHPQLRLYRTVDEDLSVPTPIESLNALYKIYNSTYRVEKEKAAACNALDVQIRKYESYIYKSTLQLDKIASAESYRNMGDLIMANLHLIKPHTSQIDLTDFYTGKPVNIKLRPLLSPQANAEKYYKKAKKQRLETEALWRNIELKKEAIASLKEQKLALDKVAHFKQLQKVVKPRDSQGDLPYHMTKFMEHEILIGKNAKKNELLTFGLARKDDLFLHAKDVPGSHVIIRRHGQQNFPQPVIEKAAALAAFYSKNRSVSLCNVLYTPKKYVRKARGGPAGAVVIEREKVVLVKPESLSGALED
ncbi:MAG: DUF814 domain-containing protein [Cyclobacteriaceae bacterium]|nr:DUF814 domain-containing protein [Cyclobacteriaceae bacterium]